MIQQADRVLPLPIGTQVEFATPYGSLPGRRAGTIVARMVANPRGFFPEGRAHYLARVWSRGTAYTIVVAPDMIERVC